jgi:hypothetical protein
MYKSTSRNFFHFLVIYVNNKNVGQQNYSNVTKKLFKNNKTHKNQVLVGFVVLQLSLLFTPQTSTANAPLSLSQKIHLQKV